MSIRKYIAYLKTIETGSITHAAAQLGYTQSAISRMIADLEDSWGVKLLTRNRSGIEISSEGLTLLPKLQAICKDYEDLNYAISELHGLSSGSIRLGARAEGKSVVLFVDGGTAAGIPSAAEPTRQLEADGGAAHGTGLKLVRQIAEAHGGTVQFRQGASHGLEVSISLPTSNA